MFLTFAEWCHGLAISQAYRESLYLLALTQCLHLVAVTTFVGAILIGDLHLLGWVSLGRSRAVIARSVQRIVLWAGLAVLLTGIPQFAANAPSYARSSLFSLKVLLLIVALAFTATLRRRVAIADAEPQPSWIPKAIGGVSLVLWIGVTIGGRLIAYYG